MSRKQETNNNMIKPTEYIVSAGKTVKLNLLLTTGAERMFDIIEDMTKSRPNYLFMLCWKYLTPLVSVVSISAF